MEEARTYHWEPPICFQGDRVRAKSHQGPYRNGIVRMIETRYSRHQPSSTVKAWHCYSVQFDGWDRHQHLGADQILAVFSSQEPPHDRT